MQSVVQGEISLSVKKAESRFPDWMALFSNLLPQATLYVFLRLFFVIFDHCNKDGALEASKHPYAF